jgi:hypothetical protein
MTRSLAAVLLLLVAAAPIRVSAAPVTWSWEGVVRTATGTFGPDGNPSPVDPEYLNSLIGLTGSGSFTLDPDLVGGPSGAWVRYSGAVIGCGFQVGAEAGSCQPRFPSFVDVALDGSAMFIGAYTNRYGPSTIGVFYMRLTSDDGSPLPGLPFPVNPPPLDVLAPFAAPYAQNTLAGFSDNMAVELEITRLERVPEPLVVGWLASALFAAALLRIRATTE